MAGFKFAVNALLMCIIIPGLATGHENPDCSFVDEAGKVEGLKVAEQALTALGGGDLVPPHQTVFLPNDIAFTSLNAALNTTAKDLLSVKVLQNKTVAILAYHVLQPDGIYLADDLVSNKTLPTLLGELTDKPYPLNFQRETEGTKSVLIRGAASNATIVGESTKICEREVHIIDTVLLPGVPADIPTNVPALYAAKMDAAEAAEAPDSDGDDGMPTAAPSGATTTTVSSVFLASIAASVVLAAL